MRLHRLDRARWKAIADEIEALVDEIAEDPYPDTPLEDCPPATDEEWPVDSVEVEVWRLLSDAAMFARIHAKFPSLDVPAIRRAFQGSRRETG